MLARWYNGMYMSILRIERERGGERDTHTETRRQRDRWDGREKKE